MQVALRTQRWIVLTGGHLGLLPAEHHHRNTIQNNPRCALRIVEETSSSRYLALEKLLLRDDSARWVSLSPAITGFN